MSETVATFTADHLLFYFHSRAAAPNAPVVLALLPPDDAADLAARLPENLNLLALDSPDWERDFSPWAAPRVFKKAADFSGGADAFLARLNAALPQALAHWQLQPETLALAGYSLGGLFAAYAACRDTPFARFACVSPSLWFDGWTDFAAAHTPRAEKIYFSLGDGEAHGKNPRLAAVETNSRATAAIWHSPSCQTVFELNRGGHFQDVGERMARAAARLFADTPP